ncbi:MAG: hypothetical protein ABUL62_01955 [Myxococcales bacterium]
MKSFISRAAGGLLGCLGLLVTLPAVAQSRGLAEAERAYQAVDFPATHSAAQHALEAGSATREQTARLYVLLGISAAAQGNAEEAKQDYLVALAINPSFKLDKGLSPKIRDPYLEAQGYWAASAQHLSLSAKPGSDREHLIVSLVDPATLVTRVELRIEAPGVLPRDSFQLDASAQTRFALPAGLSTRGYEYAARALDKNGNVLAEFGTDNDPQTVRAPDAAPLNGPSSAGVPHARSYLLPVVLGAAGVGAVAAGVVFHIKREQAAHEWNGPNCETPGLTRLQSCQHLDSRRQTDERFAIGFYAAGGALLTGSLIALVAGRPNETPEARTGLLGCNLLGTALSCDGRF